MKGGAKMESTQDVLVRNIPVELLEELKKRADENLRSRNNEILSVLRNGVAKLPFEE